LHWKRRTGLAGKSIAENTLINPNICECKRADEADEAVDLSVVEEIVRATGDKRSDAITILQEIQKSFGYLPAPALRHICKITEIHPAQVEGISTFYSQFRHMPLGRHLVSVCHGTACHVAGAEGITEVIYAHLGIDPDKDTDNNRLFTVQKVACLGCCSLAPVMRIDENTYGFLTRDSAPGVLKTFLNEMEAREKTRARGKKKIQPLKSRSGAQIRIALDSCCIASGTLDVKKAIERDMAHLGISAEIKYSGCHGMCHRAPLVEFIPDGRSDGISYSNVTPELVRNLLRANLRPVGIWEKLKSTVGRAGELLFNDKAWLRPNEFQTDPRSEDFRAFKSKQKMITLESCGEWDPDDIDEYISFGGFSALKKAQSEMNGAAILNAITDSGLRGRGGAGYLTGKKYDMVRRNPALKKYIVMNGDEGDPGAFMDRMLLESCPFRVLEGIAIAALAVGAREGYLYIRAEYPLAVKRIKDAIKTAEQRRFIGANIPGSDFMLKLHVREGAGAFVCGEETGLIASLEGKRGMPRFRPPFPAQCGLWGAPTCISNVETFANIPWIIRNGPEEFSKVGTESSKGTKVFALAGKVKRGGLIEIPMGVTIREIVEEIGGGVREGQTFKGVQIGGPAGGCVPAELCDTPVDFEALNKTGAIMGSGGLVVLDDTTCIVDLARFFLRGTQDESCGKCTFCRVGTKRMLEILDKICDGEGKPSDIELLKVLANRIQNTSLCGLGQNAPNPVITALRFFEDEFNAHIDGRCPAKTCRALIRYRITDKCIGCTLCAQQCPVEAIIPRPYEQQEIDGEVCVRCGTCKSVCPVEAIEVE